MIEIGNKSSVEIGTIIDDFERDLQMANKHFSLVKESNHKLAREILELRIKKKDNDIMVEKANENVKRLESDLKILRNAFWNAKRSGT